MPPRVPTGQLLDDIRRVYERVGSPPTEEQYNEHGEYHSSTLRSRFGTYTNARTEADLPDVDMRGGQNKIPRSELISELKELRDKLGHTPRRDEMAQKGKYSGSVYEREFGTWNTALKSAGMDPVHEHEIERNRYSCSNCGDDVYRLESDVKEKDKVFCDRDCLGEYRSSEQSGQQHHQFDRVEVQCDYCGDDLLRKPSVVKDREHTFCDTDCYGQWCSEERTGETHPRWKGGGEFYRGPNWHVQRRKCLERDNYRCQRCVRMGKRGSTDVDREPSVHHIRPVREFYREADGDPDWDEMNSLDNLVTLCPSCHHKIENLPVRPQFLT